MSKLPEFIDTRLPRHEKEILIREILEIDRAQLSLGDYTISQNNKKRLIALQEKLLDGYPLQYALKKAHFLDLILEVDENVLIPRPETEILAREALKHKNAIKILEIGVGSGCISIYLATKLTAQFTATDISPLALKVARKNAKKYNTKIKFIRSDLFDKVSGKFDLIIANLPYGTSKQCTYSPNEPRLAIFGGEKGFEIINRFMSMVRNHLNTNGTIMLEIDPSQNNLIKQSADKYGFKTEIKKDLNQRDRLVILR